MSKSTMLLVAMAAAIFISAQAFANDAARAKTAAQTLTPAKPTQVKVVANEMTASQYSEYLQKKFNLPAAQPSQR